MPSIADDPGLLYVLATLIPLLAFVAMLIVGGITRRSIALADSTNSMPPLAPNECPSWLLVLEMLTDLASAPNTCLIASVSALSPKGVLVPWALM